MMELKENQKQINNVLAACDFQIFVELKYARRLSDDTADKHRKMLITQVGRHAHSELDLPSKAL